MEINETDDYYTRKQGQYPVIYINLSSLCCNSYQQTIKLFEKLITQLYKHYQSDLLANCNKYQERRIQAILNGTANIQEYYSAIRMLTDYLHNIFKNRVVILIEDYDLSLNNAREHYFAHELELFLVDIFRPVFKGNEHLQTAILMGKESFPHESMYSGLNNITVYHYNDHRYNPYFGFSVVEVEDAINRLDTQREIDANELVEKLCQYYGGYYANDMQILNPQCVDEFITDLEDNEINFNRNLFSDIQFIINTLKLDKNNEALLHDFKTLANGEPVNKEIHLQANYQRYKDKNYGYLWGYMVNFGYLTYKKVSDDFYDNNVTLQVPNLTSKQLFLSLQELVINPIVPNKLVIQHETQNLSESCIGMFAFNASDLQHQDKQLYKRLLHRIECSQIDDTQLVQEITSTMEEFCKMSVYDRGKKRDQLREFLIVLEEKSNINAFQIKK